MKSSALSYFKGTRLALSLAIIIILEVVFTPLVINGETIKTEEELFQKYRPLAIDESVTVERDPVAKEKFILDKSKPISSYYRGGSIPGRTSLEPLEGAEMSNIRANDLDARLTRVEDYSNQRLDETLFALPEKETSKLTQLIASRQGEPATFMSSSVVKPISITPTSRDKERGIIARYRVMIPVFVPAVESMSGRMRHSRKPVEFVKEEVTEMVPVKRIVSHKKEIVKVEKVPQTVVTDYVQTNGNQVPTSVTDRAMLGEKVIKSVVENID